MKTLIAALVLILAVAVVSGGGKPKLFKVTYVLVVDSLTLTQAAEMEKALGEKFKGVLDIKMDAQPAVQNHIMLIDTSAGFGPSYKAPYWIDPKMWRMDTMKLVPCNSQGG